MLFRAIFNSTCQVYFVLREVFEKNCEFKLRRHSVDVALSGCCELKLNMKDATCRLMDLHDISIFPPFCARNR
jgi:hypothetical protein